MGEPITAIMTIAAGIVAGLTLWRLLPYILLLAAVVGAGYWVWG